jgi:hypothetical protein
MPTVAAVLIAMGVMGGVWTGGKIVHGVKKVEKQTVCVVKTGHKCPKAK